MAEIKEEVIDELLDDEDRAKLEKLDKSASTKDKADNLNKEEKETKKVEKTKDKISASAIRMAVAALILALCTLGYCYYSITMNNDKIDALLSKNNNMEYTLKDVKENEEAINNRFSDIKVDKSSDEVTAGLLAKSINVKEASIFDYNSDNYRYCNIPVRVTNVSSEKATYTVSFALTTTDKDGKPLVRNESIVVDDLADGATRDYAIFSSTGDGCALMRKTSNVVITKVVK